MSTKRLKSVGVLLMAFSILGLLGCNKINDDTADRVVAKISEKYDGDFEVTALGNRFGIESNDTVTAFVKEKKDDVIFKVMMDTEGVNEFEDYPRRKLAKELETTFIQELEKQGIDATTSLNMISEKGIESVELSISDYIESHTPDYFVGDVLLKENEDLNPKALIQAYQSLYSQLKQTPLQTNIWVISSEEFDKAKEEFNENPGGVSDSWYEDYNVITNFYVDINGKGIQTNNEELKSYF